MLFKERFNNSQYPKLFDTLDDLNIKSLPPWDFITDGFELWEKFFIPLGGYIPFAKMINDDVIAAFSLAEEKVFLFNLPLKNNSHPFKTYNNVEDWLRRALEDVHEYLVNY